jgi:hypothetical protein
VGTLPPEVHKDVVHHSLLQGCHVAVRKESMVKFTVVFSPSSATDYYQQCCRSGMFIPDPNFIHPGSQVQGKKIPDPGSGSA